MKIGVNTRMLIEGKLEGVGLFTHEVLRRLPGLLPHDEFLFFFDRKPAERFLYSDRVTGIILPPQARHPVLWYWWFERSLPAALKRYGADLLFSPDGYGSLRAQVPQVIALHDLAFAHYPEHLPNLVGRFFNHYTPKYARKAAHLVTVSEFTKNDIASLYGTDPAKITVVGNGCDAAIGPLDETARQLIRSQYTDRTPYFIYVGSVHPRKNTARLFEAFDRFKDSYASNIKLVIAGRWAWKTGEAEQAYKRMRHRSDVVLLGHLDRGELGRLLASALALVYPSLFEGFGIPVLEAMHAEVPVITSRGTSMEEVAGPAACYIDPHDTGSLAAALRRVATDLAYRETLVSSGRERRTAYSWDLTARRVAEVIEGIKEGGIVPRR